MNENDKDRRPSHDPVDSHHHGDHGDHVDPPVRVRLNKLLADCGVASRRKADELIADGRVWVDGVQMRELGVRVDPEAQRVEVDGRRLTLVGLRKRYYLLNKPAGVICTNERNETRPRAVDLITDRDKGRIYTVGRLDEDTVGLVILTSDGEFANRIMHPRFSVPKTYVVRVLGRISDVDIQQARDGVRLAEGRTAGARVLVKKRSENQSLLWVTLNEGKNREIRRVFAKLGYAVTHLRRNRIGTISDRGLKTGRWRPLTRAEVSELLDMADTGEGEGRSARPRGAGAGAVKRPRTGPWADAARGASAGSGGQERAERPGARQDNRSGGRTGGRSNTQDSGRGTHRPAGQYGGRPGAEGGARRGTQGGGRPGARSGGRPGTSSGARHGSGTGGKTSGGRPGGARTGGGLLGDSRPGGGAGSRHGSRPAGGQGGRPGGKRPGGTAGRNTGGKAGPGRRHGR